MSKKIIIMVLLMVLFTLAIISLRLLSPEDTWLCQNGIWVEHGHPSTPKPTSACPEFPSTVPNQKACTMEAKLCPDGSSVGRVPPNCDFAPCPEITTLISESEAKTIAQDKCLKSGESLTSSGTHNPNSQTWWFNANLKSTPRGMQSRLRRF